MTVLAIDTTTDNLGVALYSPVTGVKHIFSENTFRKQSSMLHVVIGDILKQANTLAKNIDLVVVTKGPGSFTGVRIGLAAAQGLAKAVDIPLIGVSTLEVMPEIGEKCTVWLGAIRDEVYSQSFDENAKPLNKAEVLPIEHAIKQLQEGQVLHVNGVILPENMPKTVIKNTIIDPVKLAKIGLEIYNSEGAKPIQPIYLSKLKYRKLSDK